MKRATIGACVCLAMFAWITVPSPAEENHIVQYNPNIPGGSYSIHQGERTITINAGSTHTFKFEAYDLDTPYPYEPGVINEIGIDDNGAGQVRVIVVGHGERVYGARDVNCITLWDTAWSELVWIRISGDLGANGISAVDQVGTIQVERDLLDTIWSFGSLNALYVGRNMIGDLACTSLGGVTVYGDGPHTGNIQTGSSWAGDIYLAGNMNGDIIFNSWPSTSNVTGTVTIAGTMSGLIQAPWSYYSGPINIGDVAATGGIQLASMYGDITIDEDMSGHISMSSPDNPFTGVLDIGGDLDGTISGAHGLDGRILIRGSLFGAWIANEIEFAGAMGAGAAISVDYDGWHADDTWGPGARVVVAGEAYTGNDPTARVYEITMCKGDLNNDGGADFGDINPFTLALSDEAAYAAAYPGLHGSRIYHGDVNCDGAFDFGDINPFVALVSGGGTPPPCVGCPEGLPLGGGPPDVPPAELAIQLASHLDATLLDSFVGLLETYVAAEQDGELRTYWQMVYAALLEA